MGILRNIRFTVLLFAVLLSIAVFYQTVTSIGYEAGVRSLVKNYALIAVAFLYVTLLVGPLTFVFRSFPHRAQMVKAARALGVASFYYAALHGSLVFFGGLNGFAGLFALRGRTLLAILLGMTVLVILFFLAVTSTDYAVRKMGIKRWKLLHRFVYAAGLLTLLHTYFMSSRLYDPSSGIAWIFAAAMILLLSLEAVRVTALVRKKMKASSSDPDGDDEPPSPPSSTFLDDELVPEVATSPVVD